MKKRVLFICTGNVFRSVAAEYALKKYLKDNGIRGWTVGSAGTTANKQPIHPATVKALKRHGIDVSDHRQRRLTKSMLDRADAVICMAQNHVDFIRLKFHKKDALLFNKLAIEKDRSIWDVGDEVPDYLTNRKGMDRYLTNTVNYIVRSIPKTYQGIRDRYYMFSDFVSGERTHRNGYPFIKLHETRNTVSFMSIDLPKKEDGHILVIPKKRYQDISSIPLKVLGELASSIQQIGKAITKNHGGYNVLLNNGIDAGQYIFHTHFHMIPRNYNDGIRIEVWDHRNIGRSEFIKLNRILASQIRRTK